MAPRNTSAASALVEAMRSKRASFARAEATRRRGLREETDRARRAALGRPKRGAVFATAFDGADSTRLLADWGASILATDQEVYGSARLLRARARALVRNNAYASGFVDELANNVVGPEGVLLQAKITSAKGRQNKKTNTAIESAWLEWGNPETCSIDGHDSWVDLQRTVIQTIATDGECFLRHRPGVENAFGYALQILDADLLDETFKRRAENGQNEIRMGVELDADRRPVAYWFWRGHPSEPSQKRERVRVPAAEIVHLFVRYRAGQTRGVTWFAPVLTDVQHLDGYSEAELVAARGHAAQMGFIVNKTPEAIAAWAEVALAQKSGGPAQEGDHPESSARVMEASPGMIPELLPGQEIQSFSPTHPNAAFKDFTKAVLRAVARGLGMAYTTLTGDLEAVNYSSIRAGLLSERDRWRALQRWLSVSCHRRVYRAWLPMALLSGAVRVDSRIASTYYAVAWKPRGWKWVDPVNDLTAAALAIALGLNSRARIAAEQGFDFEEIIDELAAEQEYADEMGVDISGVVGGANTPQSAPPPAPAEDEQDTSGGPDDTSEPDDDSQPKARVRALELALTLEKRRLRRRVG